MVGRTMKPMMIPADSALKIWILSVPEEALQDSGVKNVSAK